MIINYYEKKLSANDHDAFLCQRLLSFTFQSIYPFSAFCLFPTKMLIFDSLKNFSLFVINLSLFFSICISDNMQFSLSSENHIVSKQRLLLLFSTK